MNLATDLLRAVFALAFVLGLMWLLSRLIKKYGNRLGLPTPTNSGRNRRLQLVEILPLDNRNKLAIIRRDDQEHLLLLGAEHAQIVETHLPSPQITEKA